MVGCICCLVQSLVAISLLLPHWWRHRTCVVFLKIQCCLSVLGAMSIFIYSVHSFIPKVSKIISGFHNGQSRQHLRDTRWRWHSVILCPEVTLRRINFWNILNGEIIFLPFSRYQIKNFKFALSMLEGKLWEIASNWLKTASHDERIHFFKKSFFRYLLISNLRGTAWKYLFLIVGLVYLVRGRAKEWFSYPVECPTPLIDLNGVLMQMAPKYRCVLKKLLWIKS